MRSGGGVLDGEIDAPAAAQVMLLPNKYCTVLPGQGKDHSGGPLLVAPRRR